MQLQAKKWNKPIIDASGKYITEQDITAVSYTHLDVYKRQVHIMPDKTHGMVIHEQICINLLVTVLAKGAALGKVGMLLSLIHI